MSKDRQRASSAGDGLDELRECGSGECRADADPNGAGLQPRGRIPRIYTANGDESRLGEGPSQTPKPVGAEDRGWKQLQDPALKRERVLHLRGCCDTRQVREVESLRRGDGIGIEPRRDGEGGTGGRCGSHLVSREDGAGTRRVPQLSALTANGLQRRNRMLAG